MSQIRPMDRTSFSKLSQTQVSSPSVSPAVCEAPLTERERLSSAIMTWCPTRSFELIFQIIGWGSNLEFDFSAGILMKTRKSFLFCSNCSTRKNKRPPPLLSTLFLETCAGIRGREWKNRVRAWSQPRKKKGVDDTHNERERERKKSVGSGCLITLEGD